MIAILLLDIQTNKFIALPSFPNSYHLRANFPNYKGPGPQIQMSRKITVYLLYRSVIIVSIVVICLKTQGFLCDNFCFS